MVAQLEQMPGHTARRRRSRSIGRAVIGERSRRTPGTLSILMRRSSEYLCSRGRLLFKLKAKDLSELLWAIVGSGAYHSIELILRTSQKPFDASAVPGLFRSSAWAAQLASTEGSNKSSSAAAGRPSEPNSCSSISTVASTESGSWCPMSRQLFEKLLDVVCDAGIECCPEGEKNHLPESLVMLLSHFNIVNESAADGRECFDKCARLAQLLADDFLAREGTGWSPHGALELVELTALTRLDSRRIIAGFITRRSLARLAFLATYSALNTYRLLPPGLLELLCPPLDHNSSSIRNGIDDDDASLSRLVCALSRSDSTRGDEVLAERLCELVEDKDERRWSGLHTVAVVQGLDRMSPRMLPSFVSANLVPISQRLEELSKSISPAEKVLAEMTLEIVSWLSILKEDTSRQLKEIHAKLSMLQDHVLELRSSNDDCHEKITRLEDDHGEVVRGLGAADSKTAAIDARLARLESAVAELAHPGETKMSFEEAAAVLPTPSLSRRLDDLALPQQLGQIRDRQKAAEESIRKSMEASDLFSETMRASVKQCNKATAGVQRELTRLKRLVEETALPSTGEAGQLTRSLSSSVCSSEDMHRTARSLLGSPGLTRLIDNAAAKHVKSTMERCRLEDEMSATEIKRAVKVTAAPSLVSEAERSVWKVIDHKVAIVSRKVDQSCRAADALQASMHDEQALMMLKMREVIEASSKPTSIAREVENRVQTSMRKVHEEMAAIRAKVCQLQQDLNAVRDSCDVESKAVLAERLKTIEETIVSLQRSAAVQDRYFVDTPQSVPSITPLCPDGQLSCPVTARLATSAGEGRRDDSGPSSSPRSTEGAGIRPPHTTSGPTPTGADWAANWTTSASGNCQGRIPQLFLKQSEGNPPRSA
ncbi:hypothetical protein FOZ60_015749 [Perkinsus olseni]|uniref:Uncharacterized protein n=1 Tax=Perkinsus olseni TaxID=32597 RepID=A0A7J6P5D2_PEROL|nr:hypothetical protein FOZ60_015749 [Perkinsus olseni]